MSASLREVPSSVFDYEKDFPPLCPSQSSITVEVDVPQEHTLPRDYQQLTSRDSSVGRICSIRGRFLCNSDVGEYIVRPQPRFQHDYFDLSGVPFENCKNFTEQKLLKIKPNGQLLVETNYKEECESYYPNDGGWLPVKELQNHLDSTGEVLYKSRSIFTGGSFYEP